MMQPAALQGQRQAITEQILSFVLAFNEIVLLHAAVTTRSYVAHKTPCDSCPSSYCTVNCIINCTVFPHCDFFMCPNGYTTGCNTEHNGLAESV